MLAGQVQYRQYELLTKGGTSPDINDASTRIRLRQKSLDDAIENYRKALELSPRMAPGWYDLGNLLVERQDFEQAIDAYTKALELKDDMGEAYFNRGYVHLKQGNSRAGIADLGKAGEHGIVGAYSLIKRISN